MKRIKYLLIITLLFILSGCEYFLIGNPLVDFEIENNIEIPIGEYNNFNWSKVITVKYDNKIIIYDIIMTIKINVRTRSEIDGF